ncbi:hypothetical protein NZK27_11970 [Synechococcus sp. FGCU-3]|nr:hypothetical protein [Synechococcus sp. FGCU3]
MTPLPPGALEQLLQTLPPERPDPFPHLANLSPDQLLQRRVEVSAQLKTLEQERQAIDAELLEVFSDAELRFGVRAPGGWVLRQRSRTSWDYAPEVSKAIKDLQKQAQRDGRAQPLVNTYLVAVQEVTRESPTRQNRVRCKDM